MNLGDGKHKLLVFLIQSHELLQHKHNQCAVGVRVFHKLKKAWLSCSIFSWTAQELVTFSKTQSFRALRCSSALAVEICDHVSGWKRDSGISWRHKNRSGVPEELAQLANANPIAARH